MDEKNLSSGSSMLQDKPQAQAPEVFVDRGAMLPEGYGETRIVLMARDPNWMHSYWEITEATAKEIKAKNGEDIFSRAQAVIRMYEIEKVQDSKFKIQTTNSIRFMDVGVSFDARSWYLRSDKEGASWFVELGLKTSDGRFILIARSNVISLPLSVVSNVLDEKWAYIKEELDKIWEASGGGKFGMGSLEMTKMLAQRWEVLSQISSWVGGVSSGMSSPLTHPGRHGDHPSQEGKGFWMKADCELVLYGATESTATVTVAGKPVELNPDGTFSMRLALPDGKLELPVKAVSGDRQEEREIKISVERKTER